MVNMFAEFAASKVGVAAGELRDEQIASFYVLENLPGSERPKRNPLEFPKEFPWTQITPSLKLAYTARAEGGVNSQKVKQIYGDDYGVNAGLYGVVEKLGLSAGGKFVDFRHTSWVWEVTYP